MRDVGIAAIWCTVLLLANNLLCFKYLVAADAGGFSQRNKHPFMFGFWLGFQAMLSPTFLVLALFFFSFSELFEDDDVHSAGGALGSFFLILAVFLSGFWVLVLSHGDSGAQTTPLPLPSVVPSWPAKWGRRKREELRSVFARRSRRRREVARDGCDALGASSQSENDTSERLEKGLWGGRRKQRGRIRRGNTGGSSPQQKHVRSSGAGWWR